MSKMFWRPKIVQMFVVIHDITKSFHACQMLSVTYVLTDRNAHCNIVQWFVLHKLVNSKMRIFITNDCSIVHENIRWPTEVRIGFGHIRRSRIFGLRFTPLISTCPLSTIVSTDIHFDRGLCLATPQSRPPAPLSHSVRAQSPSVPAFSNGSPSAGLQSWPRAVL